MSRVCDILIDKSLQVGHQVSHSNRKSLKRFLPNLQNVTFISDILNQSFRLRVAVNTLRSVDKNGGLDNFLMKTANSKLSPKARDIKKKLEKAGAKPVLAPKKEKKTAKKAA
ncbi:MAG: 50S ribosomal protein L28 [Proteobacteria bacterium]|nr:50S ribosomal protein L28 [Pseudomonadota bacterium]